MTKTSFKDLKEGQTLYTTGEHRKYVKLGTVETVKDGEVTINGTKLTRWNGRQLYRD